MKLKNPFSAFSRFEYVLWIGSLISVTLSSVLAGERDIPVLICTLIGVTALIFVAKGDVVGQMLTVVFSLFYAAVSFRLSYYGEMITYLCMSSPIAIVSVVSWLRHPFRQGEREVKVTRVGAGKMTLSFVLTAVITTVFFFVLKALGNASLAVSTVSVATSFLASFLLLLRSPAYALAYAANDIVLISLWTIAAVDNIKYLPMIICFFVFLINDLYGFVNWMRMKRRQFALTLKVDD